MPSFQHNRAEHILAKNPSMPKSEAYAIGAQQMYAAGKAPKGCGTPVGKLVAKAKYDEPKSHYKATANPGHLKSQKMAEIDKQADIGEVAPVLGGLALGFHPGRNIAGETAAAMAPKGRVVRSDNIARQTAIIGAPLGGIAALALARKYKVAPRIAESLAKRFPKGIIENPETEKAIIHSLTPATAGVVGSMAGGLASGGLVGAAQRLRGPVQVKEKDVPDIYERFIEGEKEGSAKSITSLHYMCNELYKIAQITRPDVKDEMKSSITPIQKTNEPSDQEYGDEKEEVKRV